MEPFAPVRATGNLPAVETRQVGVPSVAFFVIILVAAAKIILICIYLYM